MTINDHATMTLPPRYQFGSAPFSNHCTIHFTIRKLYSIRLSFLFSLPNFLFLFLSLFLSFRVRIETHHRNTLAKLGMRPRSCRNVLSQRHWCRPREYACAQVFPSSPNVHCPTPKSFHLSWILNLCIYAECPLIELT